MPSFDEVVHDMFWGHSPQACGCMGPRDGEPVCPCEMRYVRVVDGHYIKVTDLGKVGDPAFSSSTKVDVIITGYNDKIKAIGIVRKLAGINLAEAKRLIENLPAKLSTDLEYSTGQCQVDILADSGVTSILDEHKL